MWNCKAEALYSSSLLYSCSQNQERMVFTAVLIRGSLKNQWSFNFASEVFAGEETMSHWRKHFELQPVKLNLPVRAQNSSWHDQNESVLHIFVVRICILKDDLKGLPDVPKNCQYHFCWFLVILIFFPLSVSTYFCCRCFSLIPLPLCSTVLIKYVLSS